MHRPPTTLLMRGVLHLERVGFDPAPRWLGVDDHGRDGEMNVTLVALVPCGTGPPLGDRVDARTVVAVAASG